MPPYAFALRNTFRTRAPELTHRIAAVYKLRLPSLARPRFTSPFSTSVAMAEDAAAVDTVERDGKQFRTIKEGKATILVPHGAKTEQDGGDIQQVFYNPIQQFNRDLSVLAIKTYGEEALQKRSTSRQKTKGRKRKRNDDGNGTESAPLEPVKADQHEEVPEGAEALEQANAPEDHEKTKLHKPSFKILDALSASGLRALRYAHELPFVTSVEANDLSESATESIKMNVNHNGLDDIITATNDDALAHMYRTIAQDLTRKNKPDAPTKSLKFDVIDLDPYGTAAPFFDAAVQAVRDDGGLLAITCTDSAVWAGHSYCEKTFALYGGTPVKGLHSHEAGLRLILNGVATSAARYGLAIEPLLSLSIDFYTKLFIKVTKSPQAVKFLGAKTMLVYNCDHGCGAWQTQFIMKSKVAKNKKGDGSFYKHVMALGPSADQFCQHCGTKMHINGPMYGGHIHSRDFVQRLLDQIPNASPEVYGTLPRLEGMLRTALEEEIPGPPVTEALNAKDVEAATVDNCPFYIVPGKLASIISCASPSDDMIRGALLHLGYQVTRSHCRPGSIKTDAPWSTLWWVMTEWVRQKSPVKASKFKPSMPAWKILLDAGLIGLEDGKDDKPAGESPSNDVDSKMQGIEEQSSTEAHIAPVEAPAAVSAEAPMGEAVAENGEQSAAPSEADLRKTLVFDDNLAALGRRRGPQKFVRYQMNPLPNWGPMSKARGL